MALRMKRHLGSAVSQLRFEPVPTRLRAHLGDEPVLDTQRGVLVWEPRRLVPVYAVPVADVRGDVVPADPQPDPPDLASLPPMLGPTDFWIHTTPGRVADVVAGPHRLTGAGFLPDDPDLAGLVVLDFDAFAGWLNEDEVLVAHAHDPFKRIDVLSSSRRIEVRLDGTVLASTVRALALIETHLPVRYYIPPQDVRMDLLGPSPTRTACAYKGRASYLSTVDGSDAGRDIAWVYPDPLDDALRVRDRLCFWAERTDLLVDGEEVRRPVTPWSRREEQARADPDSLEFG
jgi:uncharacterized protein (DUF427 family)